MTCWTPPTLGPVDVNVNGDSATVSGTAFDVNNDLSFIQIAILQQGVMVASTAADGTETWSGTVASLSPGSYSARAQAFDASGLASLVRNLPRDSHGRHVKRQLVRAATAGGANYQEAIR